MNASVTLQDDFSTAQTPVEPTPAPHPIAKLQRLMRGRWTKTSVAALAMGTVLGGAGFLSGQRIFESQAILRLYPQEANILYRTNDDSVLKTFDSFAKAETSTVASHPVMERALANLPDSFSHLTEGMTPGDLSSAIEVKRSDSLIVLTTRSADPAFAAAKLTAVIGAYQSLQTEEEAQRSTVRLTELENREALLIARRDEIRQRTLEVGGEFGIEALTKAHVEKVAQIEALSGRRAEVEATLATLKSKAGTSSADMSDDEIMRATLLDRALADLNFDRAKREAELATLMIRYKETSRAVQDKREEIAVIDKAMAERREQIKVLGQTGALTDTSAATPESSIAEIEALLAKVGGQLEQARKEARDLNAKRALLASLEQDAEENRDLLDETRAALEVIRLEAGRALPGYSVVMSPASLPVDAVEDSRKTNAVVGFGIGLVLALGGALFWAIRFPAIRHSDALGRWTSRVPLMLVSQESSPTASEMDRLRNAIKLLNLRAPRKSTGAQIIALAPVDGGMTAPAMRALGESFARAGLNTLMIDSIFRADRLETEEKGWQEVLAGQCVEPQMIAENLRYLPVGNGAVGGCGALGVGRLRGALANLTTQADVILIACGALKHAVSAELLLAESDFALACLSPQDRKSAIATHLPRFDTLPRQGGGIVFCGARTDDPGLSQ